MSRASFPVKRLVPLLFALAALLVAGCKNRGDEIVAKGTPEQIYQDARRDLKNSNYASAIRQLELLESHFPFSDPAKQGQIDLMYAYYKNHEAESAIDQADQFIRENPTHPRVDYAHYIKGLVYFESGASALERALGADMAKRPPQEARKSFQAFQTLLQQYPASPYAADARQRMIYLRNRLARHETKVGLYYLRRGAWLAAANRGKYILQQYPQSEHEGDALALMAEAYTRLGQQDLASDARRVLEQNYPQHPYLSGDWPEEKGVLRKLNPFGSK